MVVRFVWSVCPVCVPAPPGVFLPEVHQPADRRERSEDIDEWRPPPTKSPDCGAAGPDLLYQGPGRASGLGGVLSSLGGFVIRIRIDLLYPACILKDTRILMHVLMYPDASQTYLTNTITFEENMNTCILTFCIYFDMYPKESHRYIWDTCQIHQDACILRASLVSPWIHIRIHQDTCILDCSSRYIRIHRDTKSRYMYLGRDTCGIQSEMHTSNVY